MISEHIVTLEFAANCDLCNHALNRNYCVLYEDKWHPFCCFGCKLCSLVGLNKNEEHTLCIIMRKIDKYINSKSLVDHATNITKNGKLDSTMYIEKWSGCSPRIPVNAHSSYILDVVDLHDNSYIVYVCVESYIRHTAYRLNRQTKVFVLKYVPDNLELNLNVIDIKNNLFKIFNTVDYQNNDEWLVQL